MRDNSNVSRFDKDELSSLAAFGGRRWRRLAVFQAQSLDKGKRRTITKACAESPVQARILECRQRPPMTTAKRPPNGFDEYKMMARRFQAYTTNENHKDKRNRRNEETIIDLIGIKKPYVPGAECGPRAPKKLSCLCLRHWRLTP
jgi:hypothetical protein